MVKAHFWKVFIGGRQFIPFSCDPPSIYSVSLVHGIGYTLGIRKVRSALVGGSKTQAGRQTIYNTSLPPVTPLHPTIHQRHFPLIFKFAYGSPQTIANSSFSPPQAFEPGFSTPSTVSIPYESPASYTSSGLIARSIIVSVGFHIVLSATYTKLVITNPRSQANVYGVFPTPGSIEGVMLLMKPGRLGATPTRKAIRARWLTPKV